MALKNFPPHKRQKHVLRRKPRMPARAQARAPSASNPLHRYRQAFLDWALAAGYSPATAETRDRAITRFIGWVDDRGLTRPQDITRAILERYQRHLYLHRKGDGAPLSLKTQESLLNPLRAFFKWLARENHLLYNPASELVLPRSPRQLPRTLLSVEDIEYVLNQPDVAEATGLRDRAILETLYSTGMRRMELTRLKLYDLDVARGTVMIRQGKGRKDRLIPIGERACAWIARYLEEVRPRLLTRADEPTLFLTDYGEPFERNRLSDLVKRYMRHAGIPNGSCHAFRHACATHMLENGADIRFIQAPRSRSPSSRRSTPRHTRRGSSDASGRPRNPLRHGACKKNRASAAPSLSPWGWRRRELRSAPIIAWARPSRGLLRGRALDAPSVRPASRAPGYAVRIAIVVAVQRPESVRRTSRPGVNRADRSRSRAVQHNAHDSRAGCLPR